MRTKSFAPTSNTAGNRAMLQLHLCCGWMRCFVDVTNAFLLVGQEELILVQIPSWWVLERDDGTRRYWVLRRCLPGQLNVASRWYDHRRKHLEDLILESLASLPSNGTHRFSYIFTTWKAGSLRQHQVLPEKVGTTKA